MFSQQNSSIWFTLGLQAVQPQGFDHPSKKIWVPSHRVDLKSKHILADFFHKLCTTIALANLEDRISLCITGFRAGLVLVLLSWWCAEYLPTPKTLTCRGEGSKYTSAQILHFIESYGYCVQQTDFPISLWKPPMSWQQHGLFGGFLWGPFRPH